MDIFKSGCLSLILARLGRQNGQNPHHINGTFGLLLTTVQYRTRTTKVTNTQQSLYVH